MRDLVDDRGIFRVDAENEPGWRSFFDGLTLSLSPLTLLPVSGIFSILMKFSAATAKKWRGDERGGFLQSRALS